MDQPPIDGEVLIAHETLRMLVDLGEELLCDLAREQQVSVLREHDMVPHLVIHAQTDEPSEQLSLRTDQVKRLQ